MYIHVVLVFVGEGDRNADWITLCMWQNEVGHVGCHSLQDI